MPLSDELRPGPGPELLPTELAWHGWIVLGFLLAILAFIALLTWDLRRRNHRSGQPPDVWALSELDRLPSLSALDAAGRERYVVQVSEVVRRYLEIRFHVPALERTTPEFLHYLQELSGLAPEQRTALAAFLERTDLAKFARACPGPDEAADMVDAVRDLIRGTASTAR